MSTVIVMTSRFSLVYVSIWRIMFLLWFDIVLVCSGLAFYPCDKGGTFSRIEISSLFSVNVFYVDIDLCCAFMLVLPVYLHVVILYLRFIHVWDYLLIWKCNATLGILLGLGCFSIIWS